MADDDKGLFAEINRIEQQADALLEKARTEAAEITGKSEDEVKLLTEETGRQIERADTELAKEHETRTELALSKIDVEFLKQEEALETVCEKRFEEFVAWTAARVTEQQMAPGD